MHSWEGNQKDHSKKILLSLAFLLTTLLSGYAGLSLKIGCPLTFVEFMRFSSTIIWNSALHAEENGGSRSFRLAKEVALNSASIEIVEIGGKKYSFPLPKLSISQKDGFYITFASAAELQNYFYNELQKAGWKHVDQMGAGYFFEGYDAKMIVTSHFYLGRGISKISLQIIGK